MRYFVLFFSTFLILNAQISLNTIHTMFNEEIDTKLIAEINLIQNDLIKKIIKQDIKGITELLSPEFLEKVNGDDLVTFIKKIAPLIEQSDFVLKDQYYSTISFNGKPTMGNVIPALYGDFYYIYNLMFYNNESYNLFLTGTNRGSQAVLFLSLSKTNGFWKFNIIHIGSYGINDQAAPDFYKKSIELKKNNRITSSIIYVVALSRYLKPAAFIKYREDSKYQKHISESIKEMKKIMKFPFKVKTINMIGITIKITKKEGIIPVFKYVTKKKLGGSAQEKELKKIKKAFLKKFYGLEHDFDAVLMEGYNELPIDPKKRYTSYSSVLLLKDNK